MRKNQKKRHIQNTKRKNLGTANLSDFDNQGKHCITKQVLQSMNVNNISEQTSVTSSILTPRSTSNQSQGHGRGLGGSIILIAEVLVLATGLPLKRNMPILIQSNLPHITLQFGADLD
jgi:hypothetical protein